jgi:hypothetical protein
MKEGSISGNKWMAIPEKRKARKTERQQGDLAKPHVAPARIVSRLAFRLKRPHLIYDSADRGGRRCDVGGKEKRR